MVCRIGGFWLGKAQLALFPIKFVHPTVTAGMVGLYAMRDLYCQVGSKGQRQLPL
jgi:hypothetical protein